MNSKTIRTENVNASTIITFEGNRPTIVSHKGNAEHARGCVTGHIGRNVSLSNTRFGWTKGNQTWWISTIG